MTWQSVWRAIARHREVALALTLVGATGWELAEFLVLEGPHRALTPLPIALHSFQILLVLGITWTVIRAWQDRTRHEEALAGLIQQVVMAQEEERRRIAYDVHDGIAQLIVSAKQHVDTGRDLSGRDPGRAHQELARAAQRLATAIEETRRVLRALRPSAMDSLGLAEAMRRAVQESAEDAGWSARFVDRLGDARIPAAVETAAFRILQESLLNAARHAQSRTVEVELSARPGWLCLDVSDDGVGLPRTAGSARGLGLAGMQERARLLGGTCRIGRREGGGTAIRVALPIGPGGADGSLG